MLSNWTWIWTLGTSEALALDTDVRDGVYSYSDVASITSTSTL